MGSPPATTLSSDELFVSATDEPRTFGSRLRVGGQSLRFGGHRSRVPCRWPLGSGAGRRRWGRAVSCGTPGSQPLEGANSGRRQTRGATSRFDRTTHRGVYNMLAVPRQQIVGLVRGCDADVERIVAFFGKAPRRTSSPASCVPASVRARTETPRSALNLRLRAVESPTAASSRTICETNKL